MTKEKIFDDLRKMVRGSETKRLAALFETVPEKCKAKRLKLATETMTWAMALMLDACLLRATSGEKQMRQLSLLSDKCANYVDGLMPKLDRETRLEVTEEMLRFICFVTFGCCGSISGQMFLGKPILLSRRFLINIMHDPDHGELYPINDVMKVVDFGEEDFMQAFTVFCERAKCRDGNNEQRKGFDLYPMDFDKGGMIPWEEVFANENDALVFLDSVMHGMPGSIVNALPRMFKHRKIDAKPFGGFFTEIEERNIEDAKHIEYQRLIDMANHITSRNADALPYIELLLKDYFRNNDEFYAKASCLQRPESQGGVTVNNPKNCEIIGNQNIKDKR